MQMVARLPLLVGIVLCLALSSSGSAWAHAQLLSTVPAEDAVLEVAPDQITLSFNEPVSPLTLKLIGPDGSSTDLTGNAVGGARVTVQLPSDIIDGTQVLSWRVASGDGHPIGSSLVFSIGQVTGAAAVSTGDPAAALALWSARSMLFICLFVGVGGAIFSVVALLPPRARGIAKALSIAGMFLSPTTLGLQGLDALGLPLAAAFDSKVWSAALSTSYGLTAIVASAAFIVAFGALGMARGRIARALGLFAGALAALSLALSGHASATAPQWLTRPAVFLHVAGILFWVGALLPLCLLLRDPTESAHTALASFSRGILYAVLPLVLSGVMLAVVQMGIPSVHWLSPYGYILTAKLCLLVGLFALACWNRHWLTAPALAGKEAARRRLRQFIGLEMVIVIMILGLVAGWRFTPPPRALAATPTQVVEEPLLLHLMDSNIMAMVTITPGSAGPVAFDITVTDSEGAPKDVQSVSVTLSSPALRVEPIMRAAAAAEFNWRVEGLIIPIAGDWHLEVQVRVSRFDLKRLETIVTVP